MRHPWFIGAYALISISAGIICAHAVLNTIFQSPGFIISYLLWSLWALLAASACIWRAFHCPLSIRTHWRLAAASLFFIFIAAAIEAPEEIFSKAVPTVASIGDFFFFASFVPILLSITLPDEGAFGRFTFLLDSFQAAACTCLAYTVLFGAFPFTSEPAKAMPYAPLEFVYDTEYLAVVLLAALRLLLGTRNAADRYFFRAILLYTSLYAVCSGIYNHYIGKYSLTNGMDALNDIPSAALAIAAILAPAAVPVAVSDSLPRASRPMLVRLIDNARPIFLSLALIGLSAIVALRHFAIAFAFIVGAFVVYSLRASLLQNKLEHAQTALEQSNCSLSEIAHLDSLTVVSNRRGFDQNLAIEWGRAQRTHQPLSLLLVDVDHFKRINDTYGHQAGDECLRNTARVLSATLDRPADLIARYGGDEFAILLAETGSHGASTVAGRIRSAIANNAAQASLRTTLSIGVSTWNAEGEASPDMLIRAADRALYAAKHNGRDRIELVDLQSLTVK
ncbi:MAG: diguanylate cyclase [Terracidiphilus sp.]